MKYFNIGLVLLDCLKTLLKQLMLRSEQRKKPQTKAEAQKAIEESRGVAESKLAVARAEAESIKLKGEAEASAIEAKSKALNANPQLVQYEIARNWDGKLPETTMGNSSIPLLTIK